MVKCFAGAKVGSLTYLEPCYENGSVAVVAEKIDFFIVVSTSPSRG